MDLASTPIGSPTRSLNSTREPGNDGIQLTPRSKIRALLADLDESDTENVPGETTRRALIARSPPKTSNFQKDALSLERDSTDEDTVVAPRGRLAARLQSQSNNGLKDGASDHEEDVAADNVSAISSDSDGNQNRFEEAARIRKQSRSKGLGRLLKRKKVVSEPDLHSDAAESDFLLVSTAADDQEGGQEPTSVEMAGHEPNEKNEGGSNQDLDLRSNRFLELVAKKRAERIAKEAAIDDQEGEQESISVEMAIHEPNMEDEDGSDHDLDLRSNRFQALVAKKRAERIAKEAAEGAKQAKKRAKQKKATARDMNLSDGESDDGDDEAGVRLTQKSRPVRKAGKKAMEEMARETQRISRNMQLAHEARTKKKITKESLLQRFLPKTTAVPPTGSSTNNSSSPNSEDEGSQQRLTPLTSPDQSISKSKVTEVSVPDLSIQQTDDHDLARSNEHKGKARAPVLSFESLHPLVEPFQPVTDIEAMAVELPKEQFPRRAIKELKQRPIRVIPPKPVGDRELLEDDSDDDLEIVESKVFRVFDNLKKPRHAEGKSRVTLRALARLTSPSKMASGKDKSTVTSQELTSMLRSKARQQAAAERAEKIEVLKSKGVIIQTAEEREKDQMDVEDMLEKARREDEELTKKETEAEKKEKLARGEEVEESSEDEDYAEHEEDEQEDLELSGSEEESAADDEEDNNNENAQEIPDGALQANSEGNNNRIESKISNENETEQVDDGGDEEEENMIISRKRNRHTTRIIDDDSDGGEQEGIPIASMTPTLLLESPAIVQNPFGPQTGLGDAPMGLTQAFAATMADSQFREGFSQEDSLLQLRTMPSPKFNNADGDFALQDSNLPTLNELDVDLRVTQSQIEHDTLPPFAAETAPTQLSEMPDPTQDVGFQKSSPLRGRFVSVPQSTIDTVIVPPESKPGSAKKRGLLVRKQKRTLAMFSDEEEDNQDDVQMSDVDSNGSDDEDADTAFSVMKKAATKSKRKELNFDKTKSEAKGMFEEQALESEDEYAGLGGASDDSEGEEDEEIRKMIDEGDVDVNERKVAAYFAEKEREENEAGVSKLYKDINSGALRRKRGAGADFDDLDDSDDDHAARQARKQREFARMRKALLEGDSNIVKIADDPKKMAFLRAIEDRDDQEEFEFLHSTPMDTDEQNGSQDVIPDSQSENRPPGLMQRGRDDQTSVPSSVKQPTALGARRPAWTAAEKPTTLADIQATLSFLTEEPDSIFSTKVRPSLFDVSSDIELDDEKELTIENNLIGEPEVILYANPRRAGPRTDNPKFVDRLSLKKQESSKDSRGNGGQLAFMDPKFASERSFKPPTLLRKATSSFSNFSGQDENGISTNNNAKKAAMEPEVKGRGVGGGSKRSSVNWYAREAERKSALAKQLGKTKDSTPSNTRQNSGLSNLLGKASAWD